MYVCMFKSCPLCSAHWKGVSKWVRGRAPLKVGPLSQPRGTINTAQCTGSYSHTHVCFLSQLYSLQLGVSCFLMFRGAVTHQAQEQDQPRKGVSTTDGTRGVGILDPLVGPLPGLSRTPFPWGATSKYTYINGKLSWAFKMVIICLFASLNQGKTQWAFYKGSNPPA